MSLETDRFVIAAIHDGFGNQLFQYAAGLGLAVRLGAKLKLDLSGAAKSPSRPLGLNHLAVTAPQATPKEVARLRSDLGLRASIARRLGRNTRRSNAKCFFETMYYQFDGRLWAQQAPLYIDGFWQTPRYFAHVRELLLEEFQIRTPPSPNTQALARRIADTSAVGIHIRRGDYVDHSMMHVLSPAYYERAAATVGERVTRPTFFVFSDEPNWARRAVRLPGPTVWTWEEGQRSFIDDFRLLCMCKHVIMANSSFSWWAAWLTAGPESVIVAPNRWLEDYEVPELYDDRWIRL